ncbi:tectonin domain-containing protein [uncultured Shewanella sp.]|uniref:tectonin domain-containing protein n=1 Tax=uncultured Shewanella sp. TaxID=173975 RepID=UPI00263838C4|nr:tectonin domain-containing protein [uncultured Shewanella sp.]
MKKRIVKLGLFFMCMSISIQAHANWLDDILDWLNGAANDARGYIELIREATTQVGFAHSNGQAYQTPTQLAGPTGELTFTTFNIKGFPEQIAGISNDQATELAQSHINNSGWDIIGLQENWVRNTPLRQGLDNNEYPYISDHFQGSATTFGDGLSTISKYPFVNRQTHVKYNDCYGTFAMLLAGTISSPDCETEKGFTLTEINIHKDLIIHFYNTHMDVAGGSVKTNQFNQLKDYIKTVSAGMPVVVLGDFNAWNDNGQWAGDNNGSYFTQTLGLTWACSAVDSENTNKPNRCSGVDHLAYRGNAQYSFDVLSETELPQTISDHNPLITKLRWINHYYSAAPEAQTAIPIALRTYHETYVAAQNNGNEDVVGNHRPTADIWETFTLNMKQAINNNPLCLQHNDKVTVKSGNGHYFRAHSQGNLDAQASVAHIWETFTLKNHTHPTRCLQNGDAISLFSYHNDYIVAEPDGRILSNRNEAYTWETFTVEFLPNTFQTHSGQLTHVSVGSDGTAWGVDHNDDIYHFSQNQWQPIDGKLKQISVGNHAYIWGVDANNDIFQWQEGQGWAHISGKLASISVGHDGAVWGLDQNGAIFYLYNDQWMSIDGKLSQISVADANTVWGINDNHDIFQLQMDNTWKHIPGKFTHISSATGNNIWGVGTDNQVYYRVNNVWKQSIYGGQKKEISIGSNQYIWAIDENNRLYNAAGYTY